MLLAAGIPIEGLPLLFALDRIFDDPTALNITGDAACAVIVDTISIDADAVEEQPIENTAK